MAMGLFRAELPGGGISLARGEAEAGPRELLPPHLTVDAILAADAHELASVVRSAPTQGDVPEGVSVLAPVQSQEIWAAGVTYVRSRDARAEEAVDRGPYELVYDAERPELFLKSVGWRIRGPGESIAIRADSSWDVPEPELTLALAADLGVAGYTIGNDVSSRSIEGENPLYLPQAKTYDGSCSLGPCLVPSDRVDEPFTIELSVVRDGAGVFAGRTSTAAMRRDFDELARFAGRALSFPVGTFLMTGTGIVPDTTFTLHAGDTVRIEVSGLGVLENDVRSVGSDI
jgi:2-dehydro-3-deoxy-D-arabinonate dehydratase